VPVHTILPIDPAEGRIEIDTLDTADVLKAVEALACREADVLAEGSYAFSILTDANGSWAIFQRDPDKDGTSGERGLGFRLATKQLPPTRGSQQNE
jgi:hypothetical protein